jgi:glutaminyl-peptide cyclotransferase
MAASGFWRVRRAEYKPQGLRFSNDCQSVLDSLVSFKIPAYNPEPLDRMHVSTETDMPRPGKRPQQPASKQNSSRILIAAVAVAVVASAGLFLFASKRSGLTDRPDVPALIELTPDGRAKQDAYQVIHSYPHDPTSFTQGLVWHEGRFYESTGQYGESKLRMLEFPSGKVLREINLSPELFGEGLALVDSRLIQLTWKSRRGFVYDLSTFRLLEEFRYDTEGWGLTCDGKNLILSDGSSDLFYLDPQTFRLVKKLPVRFNGQPILELNELEFIDGEIWANVWQTDFILRIDPSSGLVTSFLDLKGILAPSDRTGSENVLNGIAYDAERKRIFVTGKLWPRILEIRIRP